MHGTDRDTDSLSDWGGQGDPAVTVDWRRRDEATLRPSLPPLQKNHLLTSSPPLPRARLWEQVDPEPAQLAGGAESELFHLLCSFLLEIHGLVLPLCFFIL